MSRAPLLTSKTKGGLGQFSPLLRISESKAGIDVTLLEPGEKLAFFFKYFEIVLTIDFFATFPLLFLIRKVIIALV